MENTALLETAYEYFKINTKDCKECKEKFCTAQMAQRCNSYRAALELIEFVRNTNKGLNYGAAAE